MPNQPNRVTGSLMFRMPEIVSWNLTDQETEWAGDTLAEFLQALATMPRGTGGTVSLTCLVELELGGTGRPED